jgi:uncharacterized membrane protein YkoI
MRKPIRTAMLAGTTGVIALGGTAAALAVHGNDQNHHATASYNASRSASPSAPAKVSAGRARQIAQQRVPGGTVTEIGLDHERGRAVWEVYLTKQHREYEVYIDAATSKIIGGRRDRNLGDDD